jgi:hypothetical protein
MTPADLVEIELIKRLKYKYMRCLDQKKWDEAVAATQEWRRHVPDNVIQADWIRGLALEQKSARIVIEQILLESPETGWYWDLLTANLKAVELAEELGFVAQRRLGRMVIGNRLAKNDQLVYAIAGFELG